MIESAVEEFGDLIGIPSLRLDAYGTVVLEIEPADTLTLVAHSEWISVSLAREKPAYQMPSPLRPLALIHFTNPLGAGAKFRRDHRLGLDVFMIAVPSENLRGPSILNALDRLTTLHDLAQDG